ncbi:MAG: ABC transporter permease [Bacillota bacterium]
MSVQTPRAVTPNAVRGPSPIRELLNSYPVRRIFRALVTIYLVTTATFMLIRLMPGNPISVLVNDLVSRGTMGYQEAMDYASSMFQVDFSAPLWKQYLEFLVGLAKGDFGKSISSMGTKVTTLIMQFLPWTLFVVTMSLCISFALGTLLGMFVAYRRETWIDHVLTIIAAIISAVPNYLIAILLLVFGGVRWGWFDIASMRGSFSPGMVPSFSLSFFADVLYHATLPMITYILTTLGSWMLTMKASTNAALGEDYVTVAKARGLTDGRITMGYVGRNAILPLVTQLAISIGFVVGGSILIESLFVYQGVGKLLSAAVGSRDYPLMQGLFLVITCSVIVANLLADLLYSKLDPRIRLSGKRRS